MNTQNTTATRLYSACYKILELVAQLVANDKEAQEEVEFMLDGEELIACRSEIISKCDMFASLIIEEANIADQCKDPHNNRCVYYCYRHLDAALRLTDTVHYRTTELLWAIERVEVLMNYMKQAHDDYVIEHHNKRLHELIS